MLKPKIMRRKVVGWKYPLKHLCRKISPWKNILKNSSKFKFLFVGSVGVVQQENTKGKELALPKNMPQMRW